MRGLTQALLIVVCTGLVLLGGAGCASWSLFGAPLSADFPRAHSVRSTTSEANVLGAAVHRTETVQASNASSPMRAPTPPTAASSAPASADIGLSPESQKSRVGAPLALAGAATPALAASQESPTALPPTPQGAAEAPEITLNRLIEIALENQPSIRAAEAARREARAGVGTAQAGYFPIIETTIGYNRATANTGLGGKAIQRRVSDRSMNNQDFRSAFNQNVFDSFRREWRVQAAREDLNASDFDLSTARQDVILNVQQAYYNHVLALRLMRVNEEAVERNIQNLNHAKGFFDIGTRPMIDVTRAQVDLANAQLELVRARNRVAITLSSLKNAIGVPDLPPYRPVEALEIPLAVVSLEESIRTALDTRTELHALRARIRSANANLTLARRSFLPSLGVDANWNYRGQEFPLVPNWSMGVSLTIPVLNPPLFSQLDKAGAILAAAQANEETAIQNIILEVQHSHLDLGEAQERIRASEVLVRQARENLELAEGRYEVGVGPLIDVTDAQLALTRAESESIQAIVDFKLAEARLRKAMGNLE
jgi:outer membrane protein